LEVLAVTFADLWFRARQFLIAVVGVGLVLGLALSLSGLADGFYSEVQNTIGSFGANNWVMSKTAAARFTAFSAFPESQAQAVAGQPGVRAASPLLVVPGEAVQVPGKSGLSTVVLVGVEPGSFAAPAVATGRRLSGGNDVVVDSVLKVPVGGTLIIGNRPYRVVGTVHDRTLTGGAALVYMPLTTAQRAITGGQALVTAVALMGTPASVPAGLTVVSTPAVTAATYNVFKSAVSSIDNTRWLMWIIAAT
jgi:putative ABC transport system permease protein